MHKVRWGLVSTANINKKVIPAIHAAERGELVAVASRDQDKADAYAAQWEIPMAFGGYQEMLDSGEVDAVYISLPNHLHAEWAIKALHAEVHVLCEKPFATTLEEVDQMIAASQESGCVLADAFMYRHHPQTKIIGEWVQSGKLGEITLVRSIFNFAMGSRDNVRLVPEYGGGCLWDVGVYPMSFAQFVYGGPPERVFGMEWLGSSGVDEVFVGQLEYPGGGLGQIASSFRTPFYIHAQVLGTLGRLEVTKPFTSLDEDRRLIFYPEEGEPYDIPVPEKELYLGEIEDMHTAILDDSPNYLRLSETRDHIRTVLALYKSASTGQTVELDS